MNAAFIRLRAVAGDWFVFVVIALLALSLLGGWIAYSGVASEPDTGDGPTSAQWSPVATFDHSAEVDRDTEVFEAGEVLSDRSAYFTTVTPELDGEFAYRYEAERGDAEVGISLERQLRSVSDDDEYWSTNDPIDETAAESVGPGEVITTPFSVDVPAMMNDTEQIESSLEASPGTVEMVIVAHVTMEGTIDGDPVTVTESYELLIEQDDETYSLDTPGIDHHDTEQAPVTETQSARGPGSTLMGLVLALVSITALGVVTVQKVNGTLSPSERELARFRREHERASFDEWISTGTVPEKVYDRARIDLNSLEDLVDVAVDSDQRVIENADDEGTYYVLDDPVYVYDRMDGAEPVGLDDDGSDLSDTDADDSEPRSDDESTPPGTN
ncbi:hypothetical protein EA462_10515 [Natrarchaeobius halalkaliphilus]|uniref:DUF5305 domain-containing protein n=1 Tax=Natrarchaeobius halalkaliphilus TaxID=1679091 RepID=A0A3N6M6B2_9EURY|nr:DUF5305 domain-containing protein [Natrarchaeobius halalkaliphilus]RQG88826.1 hypothetical protein EA462_10515 [Natrarchaeobius halalkaliphilus]